jgi:hypothetical protein
MKKLILSFFVLFCLSQQALGEKGPAPADDFSKCECSCGQSFNAGMDILCILYYIDGENSMTLVDGFSPDSCAQSLSRPPCSPPTDVVPKCECSCGQSFDSGMDILCTLYYINGEDSRTLVGGLPPDSCAQSLSRPPCSQ